MLIHPRITLRRRAAASVELAVVLPLLLLLLVGVWELGRVVHVQQTVSAAARDAARLAAQANVISAGGAYTPIKFSAGTSNVYDSVKAYLAASGITDHTGLVVELQFVEPAAPGGTTPASAAADPHTGVKNQRFRVRVSLPYGNVRWTTLSVINVSTLSAEVCWQCLVDDPFTVNTSLPGWSP